MIIRRDGTIAYRKISEEKDDRLDSAQLLAIADRTLGTSGSGARGGYAALSRLQLGIETSAVVPSFAGTFSARFAMPIGRYALAGVRAGYSTTSLIDSAAFATLRLPIFNDAAAIQLTGVGGLAKTDPYGAVHAGVWLAWTPQWGFQLDAGFSTERDVTITLGIARLISWR